MELGKKSQYVHAVILCLVIILFKKNANGQKHWRMFQHSTRGQTSRVTCIWWQGACGLRSEHACEWRGDWQAPQLSRWTQVRQPLSGLRVLCRVLLVPLVKSKQVGVGPCWACHSELHGRQRLSALLSSVPAFHVAACPHTRGADAEGRGSAHKQL